MKRIIILTDYKGFFGSKQKTLVYRGGLNIIRLIEHFRNFGYEANACQFSKIDYVRIKESKPIILYTSSEDRNQFYKSFIEDIICNLGIAGFFVIPEYKYLKAHNNKVAMELLRTLAMPDYIKTIDSRCFGTLEELIDYQDQVKYPTVIKSACGSLSRGVYLTHSADDLIKKARKISKSFDFKHDLKELLRLLKHNGRYKKESFCRRKFVIQDFIPGLKDDWKVLVFANRCYVLNRRVRKNDFRASGSGLFEFKPEVPDGLLDYAFSIKQYFNVPNISLDIGYDGQEFHLIEFQVLYFGTTTLEKSPFYFIKSGKNWEIIHESSELEYVYVYSVVEYLEKLK
jgi:hypothetical protein